MGEEGTPKTEMINPALLDGVSANFIVKGPSGVEKAFPMRAISVTIGRSDQCDISVKDSSMSGRHAEISKINGEIRVKDMGSANGIWLNGERVDDVELFDGDVLRLGQTSIRIDVVGGRKRPDAGLSPSRRPVSQEAGAGPARPGKPDGVPRRGAREPEEQALRGGGGQGGRRGSHPELARETVHREPPQGRRCAPHGRGLPRAGQDL